MTVQYSIEDINATLDHNCAVVSNWMAENKLQLKSGPPQMSHRALTLGIFPIPAERCHELYRPDHYYRKSSCRLDACCCYC